MHTQVEDKEFEYPYIRHCMYNYYAYDGTSYCIVHMIHNSRTFGLARYVRVVDIAHLVASYRRYLQSDHGA
jgi:hypothetical protein